MKGEFDIPSGETFVSRSFPDFLKAVNELEARTVVVRMPTSIIVDDEGNQSRITVYSFYKQGETKVEFTEETEVRKQARVADSRVRRLRKTFPSVKVMAPRGFGQVSSM